MGQVFDSQPASRDQMSGLLTMRGRGPGMERITWYEVLGVPAGASAQTLRRAYQERVRQLSTPLVAGAPPAVLLAAARAREATALAWQVLGDKDLRHRYDLDVIAGKLPAAARGRVAVPDLTGLFYRSCHAVAALAGLRLAVVRLTPEPLPVEGLVVSQSPAPGTRMRRSSLVTVQLWHPPRAGRDSAPSYARGD
jgi:hypothetical protein